MAQKWTPRDREELIARIGDLEAELARYAGKYGLSDEARRLFTMPLDQARQLGSSTPVRRTARQQQSRQ